MCVWVDGWVCVHACVVIHSGPSFVSGGTIRTDRGTCGWVSVCVCVGECVGE